MRERRLNTHRREYRVPRGRQQFLTASEGFNPITDSLAGKLLKEAELPPAFNTEPVTQDNGPLAFKNPSGNKGASKTHRQY